MSEDNQVSNNLHLKGQKVAGFPHLDRTHRLGHPSLNIPIYDMLTFLPGHKLCSYIHMYTFIHKLSQEEI